jgi:hypothetical protein
VFGAVINKSPEIVVGPYKSYVPVPVKLEVLIYVLAIRDSTSRSSSRFTYKYPLKFISSYEESVIVVSLITTYPIFPC